MIDHDRFFKELISTFFWEFIELFLPKVLAYIERDTLTFLPQEIFTDLTSGERREIDLLAQVKFQGQNTCFLIHLENQSYTQPGFERRMFHSNPVAAALMVKMQFKPEDRPRVKLEYLRMLTTLRLNPARMQLISGFVDTYLRLNEAEENVFKAELKRIGLAEEEQVMEIVTSWMEKGIERGLQRGIERETNLVLRQLNRRLNGVSPTLEAQIRDLPIEQIEELGEALLDFESEADLINWLNQH